MEQGWKGKVVVILGFARQGKSLARFFSAAGAQTLISDLREEEELQEELGELSGLEVNFELGGHPPEILEGADLLCLSGGVPADLPLVQQARALGIPITNDTQLFLERCPAPVVGITGSSGKTTTTAMLGEMARAAFPARPGRAWVGGNIGQPPLGWLADIQPEDWVILELSSFQLEITTRSTQVAGILNLTPNHLDRHHTMEAYREAKARLLDFQSGDSIAVLNRDDPGSWDLRDRVQGRLISFGIEVPEDGEGTFLQGGWFQAIVDGQPLKLAPFDSLQLRGRHNQLNALAACALSLAMGLPKESIRQGLASFEGVPHRLEHVREVGGVDWYNDSIATTPERVIAALLAFEEPVILMLGGKGKDLPWEDLLGLLPSKARHLILFGELGEEIKGEVDRAVSPVSELTVELVEGLGEAVRQAARKAESGDVVLFSPGGTSFDAYRDYEQRGEHFRELVAGL